MKSVRILLLLSLLIFALCSSLSPALADDAELQRILPGRWTGTDDVAEDGEEQRLVELAILTLDENGTFTLTCNDRTGAYSCTCAGDWTFELVTDGMDRLTLDYTSTSDPAYAGRDFHVTCVYSAYSESWVENDTQIIYLLLEEESTSGTAPFETLFGYNSAALSRETGPNMRVVNCSEYVSLRAKRSASSKRLSKVPLGALVLAFPESGEENGFLYCVYHDTYGYILSEYLSPVE